MPYVIAFALGLLAAGLSGPARAETERGRQACFQDAQIHCGNFIPDREQVFQCLVRKKKIISAECRKELPANPKPSPS